MADLLFDITILEKEIQDLIAAYPELAEDESLRADMLEGSTNINSLLSKVATQALDAKSMAAAIRDRADEMSSRGARYERREKAMRRLALRILTASDLQRIILPEATLVRVKGRDVVDITDEAALPGWAFNVTTTRVPAKTAIKEALDAGIDVPGAAKKKSEETLNMKVA